MYINIYYVVTKTVNNFQFKYYKGSNTRPYFQPFSFTSALCSRLSTTIMVKIWLQVENS